MTLNKEGVILSDMKITTKSIKWDTDGAKVKLPQVVTLTVEDEDEIADALSEEYGFCIFSLDYSIDSEVPKFPGPVFNDLLLIK